MIRFSCPSCDKSHEVPDANAGQKGCPRCGRLICCSGAPFETIQCAACNTMFDSFSGEVIQQAPPPAIISPLAGVERYSPAHVSHVHRYEHAPAGAGGGLGVAAMVLGVVGVPLTMFFCLYFGIPGLICCALAGILGAIGSYDTRGRGMAVAGGVLGIVGIVIWTLMYFPVFSAQQLVNPPQPEFTGKVVSVADGDTITVLHDKNQHRIRLAGIDAPETGQAFGREMVGWGELFA